MASVADVKQRGRTWLIGAALIVVGVLVGQALPRHSASPSQESGTLMSFGPNTAGSGTNFVFQFKGSKQTYTVGDITPWQTKPGIWHHNGPPACMVPKSPTPRPITIGVVSIDSSGTLPGGPLVAWVKCEG
jgi:hypothetical protein